MAGVNRYAANTTTLAKSGYPGVAPTCVFISHKREDAALAVETSKVLESLDIDYWLDLRELLQSEPKSDEEHLKLALAIEAGLNAYSHLLAIVTARTKDSAWVPFEIGSARARGRDLAFLIHAEVESVPSYYKLGTKLPDQDDFYKWAVALSPYPYSAQRTASSMLMGSSPLDLYVKKYRVFR